MAKQPSFQWYPKDCLTDEKYRLMNQEQRGLYRDALDMAWINDGLANDRGTLISLFGPAHESWRKWADCPQSRQTRSRLWTEFEQTFDRNWQIVGQCFTVSETDGRLRNAKQEAQRNSQIAYSKGQSARVSVRWNKSGNTKRGTSVDTGVDTTVSKPYYSATATATAINPPTPLATKSPDIEAAFQQPWGLWRKPGPRHLAEQYFVQAVDSGVKSSTIVEGLIAWCEWYTRTGGWRYCKQNLAEAISGCIWEIKPPEDPATVAQRTDDVPSYLPDFESIAGPHGEPNWSDEKQRRHDETCTICRIETGTT